MRRKALAVGLVLASNVDALRPPPLQNLSFGGHTLTAVARKIQSCQLSRSRPLYMAAGEEDGADAAPSERPKVEARPKLESSQGPTSTPPPAAPASSIKDAISMFTKGELDKDSLETIVKERESAELQRIASENRVKANALAAEIKSGAIYAAGGSAVIGLVLGGLADGAFAGGDAPWSSPAGAVVFGAAVYAAAMQDSAIGEGFRRYLGGTTRTATQSASSALQRASEGVKEKAKQKVEETIRTVKAIPDKTKTAADKKVQEILAVIKASPSKALKAFENRVNDAKAALLKKVDNVKQQAINLPTYIQAQLALVPGKVAAWAKQTGAKAQDSAASAVQVAQKKAKATIEAKTQEVAALPGKLVQDATTKVKKALPFDIPSPPPPAPKPKATPPKPAPAPVAIKPPAPAPVEIKKAEPKVVPKAVEPKKVAPKVEPKKIELKVEPKKVVPTPAAAVSKPKAKEVSSSGGLFGGMFGGASKEKKPEVKKVEPAPTPVPTPPVSSPSPRGGTLFSAMFGGDDKPAPKKVPEKKVPEKVPQKNVPVPAPALKTTSTAPKSSGTSSNNSLFGGMFGGGDAKKPAGKKILPEKVPEKILEKKVIPEKVAAKSSLFGGFLGGSSTGKTSISSKSSSSSIEDEEVSANGRPKVSKAAPIAAPPKTQAEPKKVNRRFSAPPASAERVGAGNPFLSGAIMPKSKTAPVPPPDAPSAANGKGGKVTTKK